MHYDGKQILSLYISKQRDQEPINLLHPSNHYCWIHNFDRLPQYNRHPKKFCSTGLHGFDKRCMDDTKFQEHKCHCFEYGPQKIKFLEDGKNELEYRACDKENPAAFIIYANFETILVPIEVCDPHPGTSSTTMKTQHQVCGYSYVVVSRFTEPKYVA